MVGILSAPCHGRCVKNSGLKCTEEQSTIDLQWSVVQVCNCVVHRYYPVPPQKVGAASNLEYPTGWLCIQKTHGTTIRSGTSQWAYDPQRYQYFVLLLVQGGILGWCWVVILWLTLPKLHLLTDNNKNVAATFDAIWCTIEDEHTLTKGIKRYWLDESLVISHIINICVIYFIVIMYSLVPFYYWYCSYCSLPCGTPKLSRIKACCAGQ